MAAISKSFARNFIAEWISLLLGACLLSLPVSVVLPQLGAGLLVLPVIGALLGAAQWWVLHRRTEMSRWWIGTTALGACLGGALALAIAKAIPYFDQPWHWSDQPQGLLAGAGLGLSIGLLAGIAQLPLLRKKFTGTLQWPLVNALGAAVFLALLLGNPLAHSVQGLIDATFGGLPAVAGVATAVVALLYFLITPLFWILPTGIALQLLSHDPQSPR